MKNALAIADVIVYINTFCRLIVVGSCIYSKKENLQIMYVGCMQAGVSQSGGSFGVNSALLELDNEADDRYAACHLACCRQRTTCQSLLTQSCLQVTSLLSGPRNVKGLDCLLHTWVVSFLLGCHQVMLHLT